MFELGRLGVHSGGRALLTLVKSGPWTGAVKGRLNQKQSLLYNVPNGGGESSARGRSLPNFQGYLWV